MTVDPEALIAIVNDVDLAEQHWEELPDFLKLLTVLRHPELSEELWHVLSEEMRSFVIWSNDETRDAVVRQVVNDYCGTTELTE